MSLVRVSQHPCSCRGYRNLRLGKVADRRAFTLVELLVVIGIIAVLLSLLIPSLNKAREQSNRVKCLSNIRQIGVGLRTYLNENRDYPPSAGLGGSAYLVDDWVYGDASHRPNLQFAYGAIPKAMGGHVPVSTFVCPSDDPPTHTHQLPNFYPYSYSANVQIFRVGPNTGCQFTRIASPSECIVIIDESSLTIDDGCWWVGHYSAESGSNALSDRHDRQQDIRNDPNAGRGNVLYADFHADFIPRAESLLPAHWLAYPGQPPY